jgi:hypothetical protein
MLAGVEWVAKEWFAEFAAGQPASRPEVAPAPGLYAY